MVVVPQGHQRCGQANLFYSKPQWFWPMRALDIMGKLVLFNSKPQRSQPTKVPDFAGELHTFDSKLQQFQPTRARDIVGELCHWWQLYERASMGWQHNHAKNCLNRVFFPGKQQHVCQP